MFVKFVKNNSKRYISKDQSIDQRSILSEAPDVVSSQLLPFRMSRDKTKQQSALL